MVDQAADLAVDDSASWLAPSQGWVVPEPFLATFGVVGETDDAPPFGLLDLHAVAAVLCVHVSTIKRMVHAGKFPAGYKISGIRARRWKRADVAAWIEANTTPMKAGQHVDDMG